MQNDFIDTLCEIRTLKQAAAAAKVETARGRRARCLMTSRARLLLGFRARPCLLNPETHTRRRQRQKKNETAKRRRARLGFSATDFVRCSFTLAFDINTDTSGFHGRTLNPEPCTRRWRKRKRAETATRRRARSLSLSHTRSLSRSPSLPPPLSLALSFWHARFEAAGTSPEP